MASGYIVQGQCVGVAEAPDYIFSQIKPSVTAGADVYVSQAHKLSGVWNIVSYKNGVHFSSTPIPVPVFGACDTTSTFFDGMTIGWGVVAAMVVAWSIHVLRRAMV